MDKAKSKKDKKDKPTKSSGLMSKDRSAASAAAASAGKKTDKELHREARLKEQAENTRKVEEVTFALRCALSGAARVCVLAPAVVRHGDTLASLADAIGPFVGSRVVGAEGVTAAAALLAALPGMRAAAHDMAVALRLACGDKTTATTLADEPCAMAGLLALVRACGLAEDPTSFYPPPSIAQPMAAAAFAFIFPALDSVLRAPLASALTCPSLAMVGLHSAPGSPVPRAAMLTACLCALHASPGLATSMLPVLCRLCEGLDEADLLLALEGALDSEVAVRASALQALARVPVLESGTANSDARVAARLFLACHDEEDANVEYAEVAWKAYGHALDADGARELLALLRHPSAAARSAAAEALATALEDGGVGLPVKDALSTVFADYTQHGGALVSARLGTAEALTSLATLMGPAELPVVAAFLLGRGLSDADEGVRARMIDAGVAVIDAGGSEGANALLPIFDRFTQAGQAEGMSVEMYDVVREGVTVLLGALAKHLPKGDPRVVEIAHLLLDVLTTPSESVQRSVAACLPPLMPALTDKSNEITADLLKMLLKSSKFADRKGAAFGIAGAVKGLGISALKAHGIMDAIKAAAADTDKSASIGREGSMFAIQALSESLGRLFEPYVMHVMPLILTCLGDGMKSVREASRGAAQAIMAKLSAQGVKLVMPSLLKGLDDDAWRTKQGSCQLLGSMAHLAPKQLGAALPKIVPKLAEALQDTHEKVSKAAKVALKEIGGVIRNPEVAALVSTLISAIANPAEKTAKCLDSLLRTVFVNSVDPASLALIVPVLCRGMRERRPEDKRKACRVVGNITALVTDSKDLLPYLDSISPELRKAVLDPIPDVRATAAKALGSLLEGVGQDAFPDLFEWLLSALSSEVSSVERTGAAQGLAEVCCALGLDALDGLLPEIESRCADKNANVREGAMGMWMYLPVALGDLFEPYIERCLPFLLDGLADEAEAVREIALCGGRNIVNLYAHSSMPLLLPTMTDGLFSDSWRIRQASVELLGMLLFRVSGMSGKIQTSADSDDEDISGASQAQAIAEALGPEARQRVLAAIYIARSDVAITVRQQSLHVWKTIVSNTPRTLKEILPEMMRTLIASLASDSEERKRIAGRALGDLVKKLGDSVLAQILPILQQGLEEAEDDDTKQGVCFGLAEVMQAASRDQLQDHLQRLLPAVQAALCDEAVAVREAAADALNELVAMFGPKVVAATVEPMLGGAESGSADAERSLGGLRAVAELRPAQVVEFALPLLLQAGDDGALTAGKCAAMEAIAEVAGDAVLAQSSTMLAPLLEASVGGGGAEDGGGELAEAAWSAAVAVMSQMADEQDAELAVGNLLVCVDDAGAAPAARARACDLVAHVAKTSAKVDLRSVTGDMLSSLVSVASESDAVLLGAAWAAIGAVVGSVPKETQGAFMPPVRAAVSSIKEKRQRDAEAEARRTGKSVAASLDALQVPGFAQAKALQPVLPVYLQALLLGSPEGRERAADGIHDLVCLASASALRPSVVGITGPLIRVVGDKFNSNVKAAILRALGVLVQRGGVGLRPFVPQLQTTFVKCLNDGSSSVRMRAADALGRLAELSPRVDALVTDLASGVASAEGGVLAATLKALSGALRFAGPKLTEGAMAGVWPALQGPLASDNEDVCDAAAATAGALLARAQVGTLGPIWSEIADGCAADGAAANGPATALAAALRETGGGAKRVATERAFADAAMRATKAAARCSDSVARYAAARALGRLLLAERRHGPAAAYATTLAASERVFQALLADTSLDVRRRACTSAKVVSKLYRGEAGVLTDGVVCAIAEKLGDPSRSVRVAAEKALMYALDARASAAGVESAIAAASAAGSSKAAGLLKEQARRLCKLPQHSEDEESDEEELATNAKQLAQSIGAE